VQHVRFHGLLDDGIGTLICQDSKLLYSLFNADQAYDFLLSIGMKPLVELSFMPTAIASGSQTVMHYAANVTPPADYGQWAALIEKLARHWIKRYGQPEVRSWPMEVWNEPNMPSFWPAGQAAYFELYRYTSLALKSVDADLRVGGPVTAECAWIPEFLQFCISQQVPVDFVSTHTYPTDAVGSPGQDTRKELAEGRRSLLRERTQKARCQAGALPLYFTEWSSSSNVQDPLHDESFAAAFLVKTLLENCGLVEAFSYWAFSDIFDENYFPSEPFAGGFGLLTLNNIAKPSYRAYQLLHHVGDELLLTDGLHSTVDAWVVRGDVGLTVILTNFALPEHPIHAEHVRITIARCAPPNGAYIQRIDAEHANPKRLWQELGSPRYPDTRQVELLDAASVCVPEPIASRYEEQTLELECHLPPQSVAAITLPLPGEQRFSDA
jgi:xylan 1,4-beta-xylosidase